MKSIFLSAVLLLVSAHATEFSWNVDTATAFDLTITGGVGTYLADSASWQFGRAGNLVSDSGLWTYTGGDTFNINLNNTAFPIEAQGSAVVYFNPYFSPADGQADFSNAIFFYGYTDPRYTIGAGNIGTANQTLNQFGFDPAQLIAPWVTRSTLSLLRPTDDISTWTWDAHVWGSGPDMTPPGSAEPVSDVADTALLLLVALPALAYFARLNTYNR